jgi:hypothetical protein
MVAQLTAGAAAAREEAAAALAAQEAAESALKWVFRFLTFFFRWFRENTWQPKRRPSQRSIHF